MAIRHAALTLLAALAALSVARADEQAIRRALAPRLGDGRIVAVTKEPHSGLFEVAIREADGSFMVLYTDGAARTIFVGSLIEAATQRNLTEERIRKLSAVAFDTLPLHWAITIKRGDGRRRIAILSDPNCPFCRRLEADLATVDDITMHILPYAVIRPESVRQAKAVWCSADRVKAWTELMHRRIEPSAQPDCDNLIDELIEFGRGLGVVATPTWFLPDGSRRSGALPLEQLLPLLDATARRK